jgi:CheY-like chemotaxis protein
MGVTFFGGPSGSGGRVWSASKFVNDHQDQEQLLARVRARIRELELLCSEVLVAGGDFGLPQRLLNQLWGAVGHGELPHAFNVDLPPAPPKPVLTPASAMKPEGAAIVTPITVATSGPIAAVASGSSGVAHPQSEAAAKSPALMPIPDIPLSSNPSLPGKDESRPKPPQAELKPLGAKKTVAVVDDDPMMLDVLSRILQRENFELLIGSGGAEIIQKLSDHTGAVDLLVTDYAMPDMQGRELADHVRQRFTSVKVLYQTGFSDMLFEDRVELEEGAAFLEKPFTARGLREAARLVLFGSINP